MWRRPLVNIFAPWIVVAALWLWLFSHLQVEWSLNPQYNYGWAVPFLALLMFWFRWQRRPGPHPGLRNDSMAKVSMWFVLALLFPIRVIEEANPDWRLLSWLLAICVIDFSLLSLFRTVGRGWVFVCNVFRATALVFVAANSGLEALGRWHDWIGTAALLCGLTGILGLAWLWKAEPENFSRDREISPAPRIFASQWTAQAWLALIFAGTEIWYRIHERQLLERPSWQVTWPAGNDTVAALPIPESTRVILRYDDAKTAAWEQPRGVRWWSFFAHWKPQRAALQLVRSHSPEICLPAIGRNFRRARPEVNLRAGPVSLDFRSYEFEQNGRPLFVFVCIQEDKRVASGPADTGEWNLGGRLRAALDGKRNLGQRLLEVAILGLDDFAQASDALAKTAEEILRPENPTR